MAVATILATARFRVFPNRLAAKLGRVSLRNRLKACRRSTAPASSTHVLVPTSVSSRVPSSVCFSSFSSSRNLKRLLHTSRQPFYSARWSSFWVLQRPLGHPVRRSFSPPVDVFQVFWKELCIIGARVYQRRDFEEAARLVADRAIPVEELVSDVVPLADAAHAIERLDSGEEIVKLLIASGAPEGER